MKLRTNILILMAFVPSLIFAQAPITEKDTTIVTPEAHFFATFVKSFKYGLSLTLEEEIRSAPTHRAHTTIALGYTPIPYLNIYAGYTLKLYGNQGWTDPNKYLQHRANILITGQVKLGQWNLSLREGVMLDGRTGEVDKRVKNQVDFTLRSRLQAVPAPRTKGSSSGSRYRKNRNSPRTATTAGMYLRIPEFKNKSPF